MDLSQNNCFCIFCSKTDIFKSDVKPHIYMTHVKHRVDSRFDHMLDQLINYCNQLNDTIKRSHNSRQYLPSNNVKGLVIGCNVCDNIISHYKLDSFDRVIKPFKNECICGKSDKRSDLVTCGQCGHSLHLQCYDHNIMDKDVNNDYLCKYCTTRNFNIELTTDLSPMDVLSHWRQHMNYNPFKCCVVSQSKKCDQRFHSLSSFVYHLKTIHKWQKQMITKENVKENFVFEPFDDLEDHLTQNKVNCIFDLEWTSYCADPTNKESDINFNSSTNNLSNCDNRSVSSIQVRPIVSPVLATNAKKSHLDSPSTSQRSLQKSDSTIRWTTSLQKSSSMVNNPTNSSNKKTHSWLNAYPKTIHRIIKDIENLALIGHQWLNNPKSYQYKYFVERLIEIEANEDFQENIAKREIIYDHFSKKLKIDKQRLLEILFKAVCDKIIKEKKTKIKTIILKHMKQSFSTSSHTKKFQISDELIDLLNELCETKLKLYQRLPKSRKDKITEYQYLIEFLDQQIIPLWPKGLMNRQTLSLVINNFPNSNTVENNSNNSTDPEVIDLCDDSSDDGQLSDDNVSNSGQQDNTSEVNDLHESVTNLVTGNCTVNEQQSDENQNINEQSNNMNKDEQLINDKTNSSNDMDSNSNANQTDYITDIMNESYDETLIELNDELSNDNLVVNESNLTKIWKSFSKLCTKMGHISCVYCFAFDRTGKYAFTASDDFLIKIWSTNDGRLISTLRGHVYEITDIAVNYENTLLASGDINYLIFIWCLKSAQSLYVLKGHTQQITSLKFCPLSQIIESRYLMSTGDDGRICFWKYNTMTKVFKTEPDSQLIEQHFKRSGIACSSFSSGGHLLAVGSTDFYVTIFKVDAIKGPKKLTSMKYHSAHVDRIYFSHNSLSFATSSRNVWIEKNIDKDNAFIWRFEKNSWRVIPIKVYTELNGKHIYKRLVVEMQWSQDDQYIITSLTDFSIKVWNSNDGQLVHTLRQHTDEVHVIQSHPIYSHVFLSAGYDSKAVIWNLKKGRLIKSFTGEKGRAILDAAFTADGTMFGVTTCYGQLSLFGLNSQNSYKDIPDELFFHNDYHPIKQLANKLSFIDEETQLDPHLLPIPFLVNINGNQYLPQFQRLVPGREQTKAHQNEPFICKINGNKKVLGLVLNPLSPNKSMNRKKKTNIENKVNDLIEILDFMTRSQMFDSVFGKYINIMSTKSSKEFQDFIDRLLLAINQDLNTADYYTKSNELIRYPPSELIIPILNHCLPFFVPETSDKILSDSISMKTKFKILKGLDKNDETDELSIPNDPSILSLDSFQPKSTFFSNTLIESSDDSISFSDNLKECFKCLYVTLLLASIQPKEINIKVVSLVKGLMDETVKTDQFIEQITQILDMNITIDNYSLHLKEILPELKYYLNKDLLYLNGINNVPLFAPKGLAVSVANHLEHDYCNGRFEESVDKRTLYLRDLTANPTSFREKGWKVAETQLRQRPGHWLSFDFNATWDQLWSQRDAVIQLNKEQIEEINNELKQKEIKEIEFLKEFLDNNEQQNNSNELVPELSNSQLNDTLDNQIINNEIDMNGSSPQSPTSSEESKTKGQKLDLWIQKYEVPTVSQSTRSKTKATKSSGRRQLPQTPANSTRSKHNLEEFYDEMSSNSKLNYTQIRTYSRLTNLTKSNSLIQSVSNNNNNNIMDSEPMSPESDLMDMDSETETDNGQSDDDSEPAAKKSRLENKSTDLANDNQLNAENNVELSVSETQSKSVEEQNHSRSDQLDLIISTFNNFVDKMANKESNESSEKVLMSTTTPIITESTETTITLTAKDVEKTLNLENLEQTVSKTIDIIESQYKTIITKQVVCDIETQTENIDIKPVIKSESIDMKVKKEFFYLCIFCRQLITFFHRKEAFDHLKSHLAAVIRCDICSVNFANMKAFRTHNKQHSISEKNVVNIRNFCLSIDWIESFLNFQMTDTFKKLIRRYDGFCPVCQSLKLCNYQPLINDKANNGHTIQQHIRLHLNCDKVFECKTCLKSSSDTKKYFFGTTDAHSHVLTEHRIKLDTDTSLATHYNKVETLSPNLDEHIKFCIDINNSIDDLYEINSID